MALPSLGYLCRRAESPFSPVIPEIEGLLPAKPKSACSISASVGHLKDLVAEGGLSLGGFYALASSRPAKMFH